MNELVSVIIPTYNGSMCIEQAIRSVQSQTYTNLEIIIVDDNGCGTDEQIRTQEIVAALAAADKRIAYYAHDVNRNGAAARNTGFKMSKGAFVALLDDDDLYLPNKIEMEYRALVQLDDAWGMVYCIREGYRYRIRKSGDLLYPLLLHTVVIGSDSFLIRREMWEKTGGFDESFRRHQDFEFTARVAAECWIKGINECGFIYNAEVGRNKPQDIRQAREYRAHYINKMMPLIRRFDPFHQKVIICSNAMQVNSVYLRKGQPLTFLKELKNDMAQWTPKCGMFVIFYVAMMKVFDRLLNSRQMRGK